MNKGLKNFLLILFVGICSILIYSYNYMLQYTPKTLVSQSYYIGLQETQGGDKKPFVEINSYKDCFEFKFNYLLNNDKTDFFSQGLQYYGNIDFNNANRSLYHREDIESETQTAINLGIYKFNRIYYNESWNVTSYNTMTVRNYQSDDDYLTTTGSTNPINPNSTFKISIGEDLYEIRFKQNVYDAKYYIEQYQGYDSTGWGYYNNNYYNKFRLVDVNEFAKILYESVGNLNIQSGTTAIKTFEFGDIFDFYKVNKITNKAESTALTKNELYDINAKTYMTAKITKYDTNIKRASDSLFKMVDGNANYDITGGDGTLSYFLGRALINVNEKAFLQDINENGSYSLRLSEKFINSYLPYKTKIKLNIQIDLNYLDTLGGTFEGIDKSSLSNFEIFKLVGVRDGIEEVIAYA